MNNPQRLIWILRVPIGLVTFFNLQAAVLFLVRPGVYAPAFELAGEAGAAMVQGMGLLFVMWNVPYVTALVHPLKQRISLYEAVAMQALGFLGETVLLWLLPGEHPVLRQTVIRFILFDGAGLILLMAAGLIVYRFTMKKRKL